LYFSANKIIIIKLRDTKWAGHSAHAIILVGNKESTSRSGRKWERNVKLDLRERVYINLSQVMDQWWAPVNTLVNFRLPQNVGKFFNSCTTAGFSRKRGSMELVCYSVTEWDPLSRFAVSRLPVARRTVFIQVFAAVTMGSLALTIYTNSRRVNVTHLNMKI
jgi:hypothetical protein